MEIKNKILVIDSTVIIDYLKLENDLLSKVHEHIGEMFVLDSVFKEIPDSCAGDLKKTGIRMIKKQNNATKPKREYKGFSSKDYDVLSVAITLDYVCITNDVCLRRALEQEGVVVLEGVQLLRELVFRKKITVKKSILIAEKRHLFHSRFLTRKWVDDFSHSLMMMRQV